MIGQERLRSKLSSYTLSDLPHSILLLGEDGCGKHTLINELVSEYNMPLVDISENISLELIEEISLKPIPTMYLIDVSKITERQQNVLLKFLEEPNQYTYICLVAINKSYLINTVLNRCVIFEFETYTKEQLRHFISDSSNIDKILDICSTPGQIKSLTNDLDSLEKLCDTIVEKLRTANYANTLSIVNKINLKDEFDKYDINLFFKVLLYSLYRHASVQYDKKYVEMYKFVSEYKKRLRDARLNKEMFMENFLTSMREFVRWMK